MEIIWTKKIWVKYFLMTNLFMKFQNCNLIFVTDIQTDGRNGGRAQSNMPLQLFQSWGHNKHCQEVKEFQPLLTKLVIFFYLETICSIFHVDRQLTNGSDVKKFHVS